jgi:adenylate cyclase
MLIDPDNLGMRYNLACDAVVCVRDLDLALELLEPVTRSMGRGQLSWLKADADLDALREDPRFQAMVTAAEQRIAAAIA